MAQRKKAGPRTASVISSDDVRSMVGPVADHTLLAILGCGACLEELEVATAYVRGEGSELDRTGHPLSGKAAQVYDILGADPLYADEETRSPASR